MEVLAYLRELNMATILLRLLLSLIFGGLIGLEREGTTRSAGLRTYALVCIGAALVMLIGNYIYIHFETGADVARLGAQVINGIGFLGAGAIITSGSQKVRGLTTAAALWTCACIGLAVGIGFYEGGLIACGFSLVVLKVLKFVDRKHREKINFLDLYLELYNSKEVVQIIDFFDRNAIYIISLDSYPAKVSCSEIGIKVVVKLHRPQHCSAIIRELSNLDSVSLVHKVYV